MARDAPRSIRIHCGSDPSLLAQRVAALPSTALAGPSAGVSTEDDAALRPCESSFWSAAPAAYATTSGVETMALTEAVRPITRPEIFTRSSYRRRGSARHRQDPTTDGLRCQRAQRET